jgi:hypothetical protein
MDAIPDGLMMAVFFGTAGMGVVAVFGIYTWLSRKKEEKDRFRSRSPHKSGRRRHGPDNFLGGNSKIL